MCISKDYNTSIFYNLFNNITTKCEMFQCAVYMAILAYVGVPLSNKIRLLHGKTPSNIYFNYILSYLLSYVSKPIQDWEI